MHMIILGNADSTRAHCMVVQTCGMLRHAGSSHDQGMLTKEQGRELRMYVAQLSRVSNIDTQQSLLQEVRCMIAKPPTVA